MRADRKSQVAGRRWQAWLLALVLAVQVVGPVGVAAATGTKYNRTLDRRSSPILVAPATDCEDVHCT